jgi:hypothetical protein
MLQAWDFVERMLMKVLYRLVSVVGLVAALIIPASAQKLDKKASGRGQINPLCSASFAAANGQCMFAAPTSPGSNTGTFVSFGGTDDPTDWDVFEVPTTQSVTFSSALVGSFICGSGVNPPDLNGFCTGTVDPIAVSSTFLNSVVNPLGQLTFSFISSATDLPADWVFYADASDHVTLVSSATPEPSTVFMMGGALLGMLMMVLKKR